MWIACPQVKEMDYVQGGLGWKVWGAALVLSWRLIGLQEILRGKRVLELGSGCGLCGLLVAKLGAAEVVLSDCIPEILSNLCTNVSYLCAKEGGKSCDSTFDDSQGCFDFEESELANDGQKHVKPSHQDMYIGPAHQKVDTPDGTSCLVRVCLLDWLEDSSNDECQPLKSSSKGTTCFPKLDTDDKFDWVIGSDLIYDDYSLQSLADVIHCRLPNKDGHGLFVCPIRDKGALDLFVEELDRWGMTAKMENINDLEWSNCTSALNDAVATRGFFGHGEATLHGIDHYEGGMVVISLTRKEPALE